MICIAQLCFSAALGTFAPSDIAVSGEALPAEARHIEAEPAPQGNGRRRPNHPPPSGGTPEPASLLLLGGAALGYGALRLKRRKSAAQIHD